MIRVYVPATSANLGVGYDCLGMALNHYGTFTFAFEGEGHVISGCPKEFQNDDNLVLKAFYTALDELKVDHPSGIRLHIDTPLPAARGLGSSATCIVAGILAADAFSEKKLSKRELLKLCLLLEHHPDNVAPALMGGLCASFIDEGEPYITFYPIHERLRFVTIIPDYEVLTAQARQILPVSMSYADAVYQMGRCAAMCRALELGDRELLLHACTDRMQEPYRKTLIPEYGQVRETVFAKGAEAFFISGSGSTMIAVTDQSRGDEMCRCLKEQYPNWIVLCLQAAGQGGYVEHG